MATVTVFSSEQLPVPELLPSQFCGQVEQHYNGQERQSRRCTS